MTLDWSTRNALRLYPESWRAENEAVVVGTLLDVAESEQRSKPSLGELLPLAARGAWMRARTSLAFWLGLVIVAVMLWAIAQTFDGFLAERYLTAVLSRAGSGLPLALSLAAGIAAWSASKHRALSLRERWRTLLVDAAVPAAFVALGYLACVIAQFVASGLPVTASVDARVPLAFLTMLLAALSFGLLVGSLVPRFVALPLTVVALFAWFFASNSGEALRWANLSGFTLLMYPVETLYNAPADQAITSAVLFSLGATIIFLAIIAVRSVRGFGWGLVVAAAVTVALVVNFPALASATGPTAVGARDASNLVCAGTAPEICLWPEQEVASGELVRDTITAGYQKAVALGLPVASSISVAGSEDNPLPLYWRGVAHPDRLLTNYAQTIVHALACQWMESENNSFVANPGYDDDVLSAEYATAVAIGADPVAAAPTIQLGGEAGEPATKTLDPAEAQEYLGVTSLAEAQEVAQAWVTRAPEC